MRIGFDAKRAVQNNTGLGNYSRYVVETLSDCYPHDVYLLFAPKKRKNSRLKSLESQKQVHFIFPLGIWKFLLSFWRVSFIKRDLKDHALDIYHGLSNELPFGIEKTGIRSVVTIHDLIFIRFPEHYSFVERINHRWKIWKFKSACQRADKVIAVSECTKKDIVSYFKIPEEKITVVYQGCHPVFSRPVSLEEKDAIMVKYNLPAKFVLYVGSIVIRKNLMVAVRSLLFVEPDVCLVVVGQKSSYQRKVERFIQENKLTDRVFIFNRIAFEELPVFYHLAKIFVLPSLYEGFGIPVVEALSAGLPVITATGSCLEETGGPDSIYIDPNDHLALAENINRLLNDPDLAASMSKKGKLYVRRFSDEKTGMMLHEVYRELAEEN